MICMRAPILAIWAATFVCVSAASTSWASSISEDAAVRLAQLQRLPDDFDPDQTPPIIPEYDPWEQVQLWFPEDEADGDAEGGGFGTNFDGDRLDHGASDFDLERLDDRVLEPGAFRGNRYLSRLAGGNARR